MRKRMCAILLAVLLLTGSALAKCENGPSQEENLAGNLVSMVGVVVDMDEETIAVQEQLAGEVHTFFFGAEMRRSELDEGIGIGTQVEVVYDADAPDGNPGFDAISVSFYTDGYALDVAGTLESMYASGIVLVEDGTGQRYALAFSDPAFMESMDPQIVPGAHVFAIFCGDPEGDSFSGSLLNLETIDA